MATFYNQATLSYNNLTTTSNVVSGELVEAITATKTSLSDSYSPGNTVTYLINLSNSTDTPITGLAISDNLGAYNNGTVEAVPLTYTDQSVRYYTNGIQQSLPAVTNAEGQDLGIGDISVPANGNTLVIYQAQVNEFAPLSEDGTITNTATISGASLAAPVTVEDTIGRFDGAILSIDKSLNPNTITENSEVTYTFVIRNDGNEDATVTDNAVITDTFNPRLNITSVTFNNVPWTDPANYSYDAATGVFRTADGQITVPQATFTQDPATGAWTSTPGASVLRITGTV